MEENQVEQQQQPEVVEKEQSPTDPYFSPRKPEQSNTSDNEVTELIEGSDKLRDAHQLTKPLDEDPISREYQHDEELH